MICTMTIIKKTLLQSAAYNYELNQNHPFNLFYTVKFGNKLGPKIFSVQIGIHILLDDIVIFIQTTLNIVYKIISIIYLVYLYIL